MVQCNLFSNIPSESKQSLTPKDTNDLSHEFESIVQNGFVNNDQAIESFENGNSLVFTQVSALQPFYFEDHASPGSIRKRCAVDSESNRLEHDNLEGNAFNEQDGFSSSNLDVEPQCEEPGKEDISSQLNSQCKRQKLEASTLLQQVEHDQVAFDEKFENEGMDPHGIVKRIEYEFGQDAKKENLGNECSVTIEKDYGNNSISSSPDFDLESLKKQAQLYRHALRLDNLILFSIDFFFFFK